MRANERRAEIMRVLVARRQTTVPVLAAEFEVSANTIRNAAVLKEAQALGS